MNVIGEVKGKQAILVDDEITSGGTNSAAMQALLNNSVGLYIHLRDSRQLHGRCRRETVKG